MLLIMFHLRYHSKIWSYAEFFTQQTCDMVILLVVLIYSIFSVCNQPLDIVFGIPVNQRLGSLLINIKDVFKSILDLLKVNKMQVHVGIEPYNGNARFPVHIDSSYNRESISNYITGLEANGYGINLVDAFNVASNRAFTIYGGVRQTSPKAFIILVPGIPSNLDSSVRAAARKLKGLGVKVFVIGLGNVVNLGDIKVLASQPSKKYLYAADSYDELALQAYKIVDTLCKGKRPFIFHFSKTFLNYLSFLKVDTVGANHHHYHPQGNYAQTNHRLPVKLISSAPRLTRCAV